MSRKPFTQLTLAEKIALIKDSDGQTQGKLAEKYGVARSTVQNVLKRKAKLMQAYEENEPANKKRSNSCRFEAVNEFVWEWFCRMRAANVPISGPMIKQKSLEYAASQGMHEFKGSTGWLDKFKIRHNINCAVISGEGAAEAFKRTRQQTVATCFGRTGFTDEVTEESEDPEDDMPLADLVRRFPRATGSGDDTVTEYVECDNDLVTSDVASTEDDDHCARRTDENDDSDAEGEENEARSGTTIRQAIEMTEKLRDFFLRENV
ncbi:major centromere autoantigen B-like [Penaeus monodon]|uniref:major centromere autoantigen B-like n=1 Tax=Penaeus monodon TaxID=6687 RepID=UPI0018A78737|nr:major centromere autoantigen B-like [Penaeus monodon]